MKLEEKTDRQEIVISLHHSLGRLTEEGHEGSELKKYSTEYICAKSLHFFSVFPTCYVNEYL